MGQTQLLLVVLGVLLVGVAIYVGITMFAVKTVEGTRNAIIRDLQDIAAHAVAYYWKPATQGGGNSSFNGATIRQIFPMIENVNARYYVESTTVEQCVIVGVGKVVSEGDSIRIRIRVTAERNFVEIVN